MYELSVTTFKKVHSPVIHGDNPRICLSRHITRGNVSQTPVDSRRRWELLVETSESVITSHFSKLQPQPPPLTPSTWRERTGFESRIMSSSVAAKSWKHRLTSGLSNKTAASHVSPVVIQMLALEVRAEVWFASEKVEALQQMISSVSDRKAQNSQLVSTLDWMKLLVLKVRHVHVLV